MRNGILSAIVSLSVVLSLGSVQPAAAQFYTQHNLVSDGFVPADHPDPNMVNAWGWFPAPTPRGGPAKMGTAAPPPSTAVPGPFRPISQFRAARVRRARRPGSGSNAATGFVWTTPV